MGNGLSDSSDDGLAQQSFAPVFTPERYGSVAAAYEAAHVSGGGRVYVGPGVWPVDNLVWSDGDVELIGDGPSSVLRATKADAAVLNIQIPGAGRGRFADFTVDGNGLATNPVVQSITAETSVGTRFERIVAQNAASGNFQWSNTGCEDCTYLDCATPGDENDPSAIPPSMDLQIPDGACRIIGGELFGQVNLNAQLVDIGGTTLGPITIDNPNASAEQLLSLRGCYVYDSPSSNCIDTSTNLANIDASGCLFVSRSFTVFVNGNIPPGVSITLSANTYVYTPGTSGVTVYALEASGAGYLNLLGSNPVVGAAAWSHFNPVSSATTVVTNLAGP